ncbi:hypothetical protein J4463_03640 [Candidatus Pacearchaeota archaeon]|nr:hypothetical protein [Candidatus Pacearchaeota archaeon]
MPKDNFNFRKTNQLKKADKSIRQKWDEKINKLCEKINKKDDYYTTSSCSGRILLLIDSEEKTDKLFLNVWHEKITFNELKKAIELIKTDKTIYFKQDPCILHIACRTLENAQSLCDLAIKKASWKRCGIIATRKRFIAELNSTEKIEFPIIQNGKCIASDEFLNVVVSEANKKLEKSWEKIDRLEKEI